MNKSLYNKEYRKKNIERLTIYRKERYQKNKEKDKLYGKEYRKNYPNYSKEYHQKNKERENQYHREYYIKNRDRVLDYFKKYNQIPEIKKLHKIRYGAEYQRKYRNENKEKLNLQRLKMRHERGISEKYNSELGISYTKEYKILQRQKRRTLFKQGGELPLERIQRVYEDNIKKYGTLTCYLCYIEIQFGEDSLDHKTPLYRGGDNAYKNLGIAHFICNCRKHTKTEAEYRKEILTHG